MANIVLRNTSAIYLLRRQAWLLIFNSSFFDLSILHESQCLQAGAYEWQTYQQVYDTVIKLGAAMRHVGVNPVHNLIFHELNVKIFIGVKLGFQLCKKSDQVFFVMELQLADGSLWNLWNELSRMAHFHGGN